MVHDVRARMYVRVVPLLASTHSMHTLVRILLIHSMHTTSRTRVASSMNVHCSKQKRSMHTS